MITKRVKAEHHTTFRVPGASFTVQIASYEDALQTVLGQGANISSTNRLLVEDSGTHTNPEAWLHDHHWDCNEVTIAAAGAAGAESLGQAVDAGVVRRIREITIRHAGTNNTVVTLIAGGNTKLTVDVPAQTTRVWSSEDGRAIIAGETPQVWTSDVTGGSTYVSASGVEE